MKFKFKKILVVIILIASILLSICPQVFATNGNEMSISSKEGVGNTLEIISGNTTQIKSESVVDVVSFLTAQGIIVNSINNHKGVAVELTSTVLIGTGYTIDTINGNYSVIVYGDANGDGEVDAGDMKVVIDDFLGTKKASAISKIAVDVYQDGTLDAADLKLTLDSFLGNLSGSILKTTSASNPTPTPDVSVTPTPVPTQTITEATPKIKIEGETITLTPETAPDYYGKIVTNYVSRVEGLTWRLFYVDFEGKYEIENSFGYRKGRIYLKADPVYQGKPDIDFQSSSSISSKEIKELAYKGFYRNNKLFNSSCGGNATNQNNEKVAACLNDRIIKWADYTAIASNDSYAINLMGAPSLEMYADSYNQYHTRKGTEGFKALEPYINEFEGLKGYDLKGSDKSLVYDEYGLYVRENERWWLSSPSAWNENYMCVVGTRSTVDSNQVFSVQDYRDLYTWYCPVAGIQDVEYVVELTNENDYVRPSPTPVPTSTYSEPQIMVDGQVITLTKDNAPLYYGKEVTNYGEKTGADKWRLFYVDFDGKYGTAGKIYLKHDLMSLASLYNISIDSYSSEAENRYKKMNPLCYVGSEVREQDKAILYLCDETRWDIYNDNEKADYVIGSPSLEMYLDSYNEYYVKKIGITSYQKIKCKFFYEGYKYAVGDSNENYNYTASIEKNSIRMYAYPKQGIWLASPSEYSTRCLCCVKCTELDVLDYKFTLDNDYVYNYNGVCPLACLKSDFIPEFSN